MIVNNLSVSIKGKNILNKISFSLNNNDKVGLIGINGSGKSTLLKALSKFIEIDDGIITTNNETIGYLKQEIPREYNDYSIYEYIKFEIGINELEKRLHELETNLQESNMEEYSEVLNKFLSVDGYSFDENLKIILSGLNLNHSIFDKVKILSGGEKIKIMLATLLLSNNDILLLDEPTNNLDIEAIKWLENYLAKSNKKLLIVSHDEVFLNRITNKLFELNNGKITEYNLSYSDYLLAKENEYARNLDSYNKAIDERVKLKKQINKAKEWAGKGISKKAHNDNDKIANNYAKERTNPSNVSKLSKALDNLEIPEIDEKKPINLFFNFEMTKTNKNIIINDLECGYENFKTEKINLSIPFGTKVCITGKNGSGKTTFIKTLLGEITSLNGEIYIGSGVKFGYISQDTLNANNNETVLSYLTKGSTEYDLSKIFILLDKVNISYDDRNKFIESSLIPNPDFYGNDITTAQMDVMEELFDVNDDGTVLPIMTTCGWDDENEEFIPAREIENKHEYMGYLLSKKHKKDIWHI